MKLVAYALLGYTALMLLIHVSTTKLLKQWSKPSGSWIERNFSPQRALRVEALYWLLILVGWDLWPSVTWKTVVVVFAAIHLGIWAASELHWIDANVGNVPSAQTNKTHQGIIAFDLVEAVALLAIAWRTASYAIGRIV